MIVFPKLSFTICDEPGPGIPARLLWNRAVTRRGVLDRYNIVSNEG